MPGKKPRRRVRKGSIWIDGQKYYSPMLFGMPEEVIVCREDLNPEMVRVYDKDGFFLCTAVRKLPTVPLMASVLATGNIVTEDESP